MGVLRDDELASVRATFSVPHTNWVRLVNSVLESGCYQPVVLLSCSRKLLLCLCLEPSFHPHHSMQLAANNNEGSLTGSRSGPGSGPDLLCHVGFRHVVVAVDIPIRIQHVLIDPDVIACHVSDEILRVMTPRRVRIQARGVTILCALTFDPRSRGK
jgi:hypothetical protein